MADNKDGTLTAAGHLERLIGSASVPVLANTADGTATRLDYTPLTDRSVSLDAFEALTFGGRWKGEVSVETVEDLVDDPDETFTVTVSLPTGTDDRIALGTQVQGTATIVEGPALTLVPSATEVEEGGTITLTANVDPTHTQTFTVTVSGDSDDDDRWEFVGPATLSFAPNAGSSTGTVTVRAVANEDDDGDLVVTFGGMSGDAMVANPADVEVTVKDDDDPVVSIAAPTAVAAADRDGFLYEAEAVVDDPASAAQADRWWTLTRDGLTAETLDVTVNVAQTGGPFAAEATATVQFAADMATTTYTPLTAVDDADESHGTVTVTVGGGRGLRGGRRRGQRGRRGARRRRRAGGGGAGRVGGDGGRGSRGVAGGGGRDGNRHFRQAGSPDARVRHRDDGGAGHGVDGGRHGDGGHGLHGAVGGAGVAAVRGVRGVRDHRGAGAAQGAGGRDHGGRGGRRRRDVHGDAGAGGDAGRAHRGVDGRVDGDDLGGLAAAAVPDGEGRQRQGRGAVHGAGRRGHG